MVILQKLHPVGEAERYRQLDLVLVLVGAVAAPLLGLPILDAGQALVAGDLAHIVGDTVFVEEGLLGEAAVRLFQTQDEAQPLVDHRLALEHVAEEVVRDGDVGEDLQVRLPALAAAGLAAARFLTGKAAHVFALFKMQVVFVSVSENLHIKILRGILGRTGTQAVEPQGVLVAFAVVGVVLAAGVQLTEHQLPVVALLLGVVVHRDTPAEVLHLDGIVQKLSDDDAAAEALSGLVDGVGKDLEHRMFAAFQAVGAKDDPGAFSYPVRPFQGGDTLIAIFLMFFACHEKPPCPGNACRAAGVAGAGRSPRPCRAGAYYFNDNTVSPKKPTLPAFLSVCTKAAPPFSAKRRRSLPKNAKSEALPQRVRPALCFGYCSFFWCSQMDSDSCRRGRPIRSRRASAGLFPW